MRIVEGCLKCVFIFYNSLCAIFGGAVIYSMVIHTGSDEFSEFGVLDLICSGGAAIAMAAIPSLGVYAAHSKNISALKTFAGFMGAGMIIMLISGFYMSTKRNELKEEVYSMFREHTGTTVKNERLRKFLKILPTSAHIGECCGYTRAEDWGYRIPQSCVCYGSSRCTSRLYRTTGLHQIYTQGCRDIILQYLDIGLDLSIYMFIGFSIIALLGLLISLFMIHRIRRQ